MFTSTMDLDSNRNEGLSLSKDNFQNKYSTFSITKRFPNNYSNVSDHIEFSHSDSPIVAERTNGLYVKCTNSKNEVYYSCAADTELRLASMRIFATIMLNAWRRRREDVKRLLLKVEDLKKGSQKSKNQIHVYNTLFRVEQKRNDELACQLKCSLESVMQAKSSCENLNTNVISLRAERVLLEQDLASKSKELEALTDILSQTKEQLFQSMIDQHNLRSALNKEQRSVKMLENQKNKLINENVSGQVVLITGGGGGVGRLLSLNFAKQNARVVIWDINQEAIKTTMDLLARNGYTCKGYIVDISDRDQVFERAAQTINEIGNIDILCNNAGVVCCRPFWDLPDRVILNTYNINIISHYWTVKAFLPQMMQNNRGHIVTVGSVTGMLGTYGCSDYSATKFACVGFHESLLTDLKTHGYDGIHMTLICPYYINTGMFSGVRPRMFPMLEPQYVADRILEAIRKNEVWCVLPNTIRILTPLKCILPAKVCWELMSRVIRGPESMMMFQGRGRVPAG